MIISKFIENLEKFKSENGDFEIESEYWCVDCHDTHIGPGLSLELTYDGKLRLSVTHIGLEG